MGDMSENFNRSEFACKCGCGFDDISPDLITTLENIRAHFDRPVTINSGCRCDDHNFACGGSKGSRHKVGDAADIVIQETPADVVADVAEQLEVGGLGRYKNFTHIDTRPEGKARWEG